MTGIDIATLGGVGGTLVGIGVTLFKVGRWNGSVTTKMKDIEKALNQHIEFDEKKTNRIHERIDRLVEKLGGGDG